MRRQSTRRTKAEQLQDVVNKYKEETGAVQMNMRNIAAWAIENGLMAPSRRDNIQLCARELARAAAMEYYIDPQGRKVRRKHAVHEMISIDDGPTQKSIWVWADILDAPPEHMKLSLQQRRGYIVGDCKQLKTDLDSYNDNNKQGVELQLSFDFTEDLAEQEMPTEYPDTRPEDSIGD